MILRFALLPLLAFLASACVTSACPDEPFEPAGRETTSSCECDEGEVAFVCDPDTCSGEPERITCENRSQVTSFLKWGCPDCDWFFENGLVIRATCEFA